MNLRKRYKELAFHFFLYSFDDRKLLHTQNIKYYAEIQQNTKWNICPISYLKCPYSKRVLLTCTEGN